MQNFGRTRSQSRHISFPANKVSGVSKLAIFSDVAVLWNIILLTPGNGFLFYFFNFFRARSTGCFKSLEALCINFWKPYVSFGILILGVMWSPLVCLTSLYHYFQTVMTFYTHSDSALIRLETFSKIYKKHTLFYEKNLC